MTMLPVPVHDDLTPRLIALWLHGRPTHTQRAYRRDVTRFLRYIGKPLHRATLDDLQAFADSLEGLAPSTRGRILSAVKSLLSHGHSTGNLPVNVGAALRLPQVPTHLAQRILSEETVLRMIAMEQHPRNRLILRLLYAAGLRAAELCRLTWGDVQPRSEGGQITVTGKGDKTRSVLLTPATWSELVNLRGDAAPDQPVFRSRKHGHLTEAQVWRIVRAAATTAGISGNVSPHWLRHAHASHALDRGAPIHLVRDTLGHASVATTGRYLHARPTDSSSRYLPV